MAFYYKLEMENSAILRSNDVHSSIALKSRVLDNCWHLASYPTNLYAPFCVTGLEKSKLHFPDTLTSGSTLDFFLSSISQEGKWKLCFLWQHGRGTALEDTWPASLLWSSKQLKTGCLRLLRPPVPQSFHQVSK